ncbi:MAG: hypothetical protein K6L76_07405 [Agarilytica sp.]
MAKSSKKQNTLVVVAALGVLVFALLVTLAATGVLFDLGGGNDRGYQNVTFTDAVLTCRSRAESNYGERIRILITDNHSSRYDDKASLYKIFLKLDLYKKNRLESTAHYVNCFVRASNGRVRKFEVLDGEEAKQSSPSDGTNMFGIPVK